MKNSKICTKCGIDKLLAEFSKQKNTKDGLQCWCKECKRNWYYSNREDILIKKSKNYQKNKKRILINQKKYYVKNKEIILKKCKDYRDNNKKYISDWKKEWYKRNNEQVRKRIKQNAIDNPDKIRESKRKYIAKRRKNDIRFKIKDRLQRRLIQALNGNTKSLRTMFLLSCEIDYFLYYIQEQFKSGMNWDNYGEWEIDHIKPCAKFDLRDPKQQRECFHYTNLQPLWKEENRQKSDKYIER